MFVRVWCFACVLAVVFFEVYSDVNRRTELGYPMGFMSNCPGSNKPSEIPKSQLRYLYFVVQGNGRRRSKYNYWTARNIARDSKIDFRRKTVVIAIGYLDSPAFPIATMFANEYEAKGYNVIMIDNNRFATVHYFLSCRLMRPVGRHVAEVLVNLIDEGLDPSKLELFGFSLGGQTVSYIGKHYRKISGKNVSTIVALEPAGPCFRNLGPEDRLHITDADFVQVIHTNIDGFGMANPMGHVDFYINGGEFQPADINYFVCASTCSHFSVLYYWQSAMKNPGKFFGLKCDDVQQARENRCYDRITLETNEVGLEVNRSNPGIFYVATKMVYPFYLGRKGVSREYMVWDKITDVNDKNYTTIYT